MPTPSGVGFAQDPAVTPDLGHARVLVVVFVAPACRPPPATAYVSLAYVCAFLPFSPVYILPRHARADASCLARGRRGAARCCTASQCRPRSVSGVLYPLQVVPRPLPNPIYGF
jgi:hypothetical protein